MNPIKLILECYFGPKPRISDSPPIRPVELKADPYRLAETISFFLVASIEVGNTTTKQYY